MIRVLVAEDMRILRDMLVSMLNLEDDIKVVAQVADGTGVVPAALAEHPDIAVLDIDMPGLDGLAAAAELHERMPACRVVILTVLGRPGQLRQALAAHVSGFLIKDQLVCLHPRNQFRRSVAVGTGRPRLRRTRAVGRTAAAARLRHARALDAGTRPTRRTCAGIWPADGTRRYGYLSSCCSFVACMVQSRSARYSGSTTDISHTGSPAALARSNSVWKALFLMAAPM